MWKWAFLLAMSMMVEESFSQNLRQHEWKNRLLIITANDDQNPKFRKQLTEFLNHETGMKERKLKVYQAFPEYYFLDKKKVKSTKVYDRFSLKNETFSVALIGLDGGVKLKQTEVLEREELFFRIIDSMPMRQSEIRRK